MEHFNPILGKETAGQKFITCEKSYSVMALCLRS